VAPVTAPPVSAIYIAACVAGVSLIDIAIVVGVWYAHNHRWVNARIAAKFRRETE